MPRHPETPPEPTPAEPAPPDAAPAPAAVDDLGAERDAALALAAEHLALAQRVKADYANLKRRTDEERALMLGLANAVLLEKVVALADDFDRAIEHVPADARETPWLEGIAAIDRKLRALLESEGITPIEALGRQFDPALHEALSHVPGGGRPEGEIVAELRRGYRLRDRVLRASQVAVSDGTGPVERPN